ncbi:hypothetical protein ABZ464_03920 [Streptomyces sp. NPDC005820]|uniref:hypothetical protein n=1 Tax=Streptomyces sp. NPDC005820 TaxID=3157069 RepID=UPI0033C9ADC4
MPGLRDAYRTLEAHVAEGRVPELSAVRELSGPALLEADEHDVALLLFLTALCARLDGGTSVSADLYDVARRYQEMSFLYTGRIIPRIKEMIELLDRGVDTRSLAVLTEVADHLSQGWAEYPDSVFPSAFTRLAGQLGHDVGEEPFTRTSFSCWQRGLERAAAGDPGPAREYFQQSLAKYRRYLYYADASWLFMDVVITLLMDGRTREAAEVCDEQRTYVEEVVASLPLAADRGDRSFAFHQGDVHSGGYSTFVESATLNPRELTEQDREVLVRYVRAGEFLVAACRHRSVSDFCAALDLFSFGWTTFPRSPYPRILQHLVDRYGAETPQWNVHLTAYTLWHQMLRMSRASIRSRALIATAMGLRERLGYAGMRRHADVVLLDAAILHSRLHGKQATVEWITRYVAQLRPEIPGLLQAAINYLQASSEDDAERLLTPYIGLRSRYTAPDLILAATFWRVPRGPGRVEVALYGRLLSVEGVTVYEITPDPLISVLEVLGAEFLRNRREGRDVPLMSAAELSARTGRTPAALAQTVRRFRAVCEEKFQEATDWSVPADAVIQGRPGYRFNPANVESFHRYPVAPEPRPHA